jgi:hypothetical protein
MSTSKTNTLKVFGYGAGTSSPVDSGMPDTYTGVGTEKALNSGKQGVQLSDGYLLAAQSVSNTGSNKLSHTLGRVPTGVAVTKSVVEATSTSVNVVAFDSLSITVSSNGNATIDLWVF